MARAKRRKGSSFENTQTKSIFFYGKPNMGKTALLKGMQSAFLALVNANIAAINARDDITLQLVKNDKKDSAIRQIEKATRPQGLNSAFCQNAFDEAVTKLSNRLDSIRLDMHADHPTIFTKSKVLYALSIDGKSKADMAAAMLSISKKPDDFYAECNVQICAMSDEDFAFEMALFHDNYAMYSLEYKIPEVKSVEVSLDSRLMRVEKSNDIKAPVVINITNPFERGVRIAVPLNTSRHSLHKMESNDMAGTVKMSMRRGKLRISWAYDRTFVQPTTDKVVGVDVGIIDAIYPSDGSPCGSMKEVLDFYSSTVEPSFAGLSDLRNKKASIKHYLRTHPNLPDAVRRSLIVKMDRLDRMMQRMDAPYRKKRHYYGMLDETISKSVKAYVGSIDSKTLTALEKLDIKEFNKSRKVNAMFSNFARGKLQEALMRALNWRGYDFIEVEPAYTSQICPVCGNLDSANRDRKAFKCTCCGHEGDADHIASINIRNRVSDTEVLEACEKYKYSKRERHDQIKAIFEKRHSEYLKTQNPGSNMAKGLSTDGPHTVGLAQTGAV